MCIYLENTFLGLLYANYKKIRKFKGVGQRSTHMFDEFCKESVFRNLKVETSESKKMWNIYIWLYIYLDIYIYRKSTDKMAYMAIYECIISIRINELISALVILINFI